MKRKRVQPVRRKSVRSRPAARSRRKSRSPISFSEMLLNWLLVLLAAAILVFLASWAWRFFTGGKSQVAAVSGPRKVTEVLREVPRVEVLNGCGVSGIAAKVGDYLRRQGFDVVNTDNYRSFDVDSSFVLDRQSTTKAYGRKVAKVLGIPANRVQTLLNEDLDLEATVVLGKDCRSLKGIRP